VPIVPTAILFDLRIGNPQVRPTADCGYRAAGVASTRPVEEGSIGAGAGATVGHARGPNHVMKAGIGSAAVSMSDGLIVAALAAVNAYGDVIDPASGQVIAGAREDDGKTLADARRLMRSGAGTGRAGENTTLVVVATNARLTRPQTSKVAQMAHDGIARAIWPVHTPVDGDTAFALATGTLAQPADLLRVGALAADVTADAIVRAVQNARGLPGVPAIADLAPSR
jgi:L-aminopeptidase/D-esterase-like protein